MWLIVFADNFAEELKTGNCEGASNGAHYIAISPAKKGTGFSLAAEQLLHVG